MEMGVAMCHSLGARGLEFGSENVRDAEDVCLGSEGSHEDIKIEDLELKKWSLSDSVSNLGR